MIIVISVFFLSCLATTTWCIFDKGFSIKVTYNHYDSLLKKVKKFFENKVDVEVVDVEALRNRLVLLETCYTDFNENHSKVLMQIEEER